MKEQILQKILSEKVIADLEYVRGEDCLKLTDALHKGGINLVSITIKNHKNIHPEIEVIRQLKAHFGETVVLGVNNVMEVTQVQALSKEGASFIISTGINQALIEAAHECGLVAITGAYTTTEIINAYECHADIVHVAPARLLGPAYFNYVCKLLYHIPMMTSCGITRANAGCYFDAGIHVILESGSFHSMCKIRNGEWDQVTNDTELFLSVLPR